MKTEEKRGVEILKGGDELFSHPDVQHFFNRFLVNWISSKPIALFLGCSKHKPFSNSFIHKKVIGLLKKHEFDSIVQEYIISEPLVICPREWEEFYPAAHYDFPPEDMTEAGRNIFVKRLRHAVSSIRDYHQYFMIFAPNHHKHIILEAVPEDLRLIKIPYNIYMLPRMLQSLQELRLELQEID